MSQPARKLEAPSSGTVVPIANPRQPENSIERTVKTVHMALKAAGFEFGEDGKAILPRGLKGEQGWTGDEGPVGPAGKDGKDGAVGQVREWRRGRYYDKGVVVTHLGGIHQSRRGGDEEPGPSDQWTCLVRGVSFIRLRNQKELVIGYSDQTKSLHDIRFLDLGGDE